MSNVKLSVLKHFCGEHGEQVNYDLLYQNRLSFSWPPTSSVFPSMAPALNKFNAPDLQQWFPTFLLCGPLEPLRYSADPLLKIVNRWLGFRGLVLG